MAGVYLKRVNPGAFNKRVTFCRQGETRDALGKITHGLEDVITLWADFYPMRGSEFTDVQKTQGKVTYRCFLRWHSALSDIGPEWFIKHKGKVFYIVSALDVGLQKRYLEIYCTEYIGTDEMPDAERSDEFDPALSEGEDISEEGEIWP